MANQSKNHNQKKNISVLDKFTLGYEYNVPWNQAGQTVQLRPNKK